MAMIFVIERDKYEKTSRHNADIIRNGDDVDKLTLQ